MPSKTSFRHPVSLLLEWEDIPMPGPVWCRNKETQSGTGMLRYQTEMMDVGILKVWWHEATLYCFLHYLLYSVHSYKFVHTHSFITFAEFRSSFFIAARSSRGSPLGCRAEIWTRGRLTAARHATNWAMPHPVGILMPAASASMPIPSYVQST
jgi:hypothetical protein